MPTPERITPFTDPPGEPAGATPQPNLSLANGSEGPIFNPEPLEPGGTMFVEFSLEPDHEPLDAWTEKKRTATKSAHDAISQVIHNEQLSPDEKATKMLVASVVSYFKELGADTITLTREDASRLLRLARAVQHHTGPTHKLDVPPEIVLDELKAFTNPFETSTPIWAFEVLEALSARSIHSQIIHDCVIAIRIWVLENTLARTQMPSYYDRLRDEHLA